MLDVQQKPKHVMRRISLEEALQVIALAIAPAFPSEARFIRGDAFTSIEVKLGGRRKLTVQFSPSAVGKFSRANPSSQQRAAHALRALCASHLIDPSSQRYGHQVIEATDALENALNALSA